MQVAHVPEGLEAVIFTCDGDMRQALNSLQATVAGFNMVNRENVFKVLSQGSCLSVGSCAFARTPDRFHVDLLVCKAGVSRYSVRHWLCLSDILD